MVGGYIIKKFSYTVQKNSSQKLDTVKNGRRRKKGVYLRSVHRCSFGDILFGGGLDVQYVISTGGLRTWT